MKRNREAMEDEINELTSFEVLGKDDDWTMVEGGELKGMMRGTDRNNGLVVSLSARQCPDANRWSTMPSLDSFGSLKELDLHKSRYCRQLHVSVCNLENLEKLILTRCERLTSLPESIGLLHNLREVRRFRKRDFCQSMPEELTPHLKDIILTCFPSQLICHSMTAVRYDRRFRNFISS